MKKLSSKGFAHHVALLALVVVAVIGGIGSYIYLNSSSAATLTPQQKCVKDGGVWFPRSDVKVHGPCYTGSGAYFINVGNGTVKKGVADVRHYTSGQSPSMENPNFIVVVSGKWKVCDDKVLTDICTIRNFSSKGSFDLCTPYDSSRGSNYDSAYKYCSKTDIYIRTTTASGAITVKQDCQKYGNIWFDEDKNVRDHSPCYRGVGAYEINVGKGVVSGLSDVQHVESGKSKTMDKPNYVVILTGKWKVCIGTECTISSYSKGVVHLCDELKTAGIGSFPRSTKFCSYDNVYIKRV